MLDRASRIIRDSRVVSVLYEGLSRLSLSYRESAAVGAARAIARSLRAWPLRQRLIYGALALSAAIATYTVIAMKMPPDDVPVMPLRASLLACATLGAAAAIVRSR